MQFGPHRASLEFSLSCGAHPCVKDVEHTVRILSENFATFPDWGDQGLQQLLQAALYRYVTERGGAEKVAASEGRQAFGERVHS